MWTPNTICDGPYSCRQTVREAVKFGADGIKMMDIIATDHSPLEDINELQRVNSVIKAGKLIR